MLSVLILIGQKVWPLLGSIIMTISQKCSVGSNIDHELFFFSFSGFEVAGSTRRCTPRKESRSSGRTSCKPRFPE